MWKKILLGALGLLAIAVVVFVVLVMLQPTEFRVARSAAIPAPAEQIFPFVNDLRLWQTWSPWAKLDPNAKVTFEGPDAGEGAKFHWDGNDDIGAGAMTIVESKPPELVRFKLEFTRPFEDTCDVDMALQPAGEGTEVTWEMHGKNNFISKAMCMFMDMDAMVGGDFEKGLANLKAEVEKASTAAPDADEKNNNINDGE